MQPALSPTSTSSPRFSLSSAPSIAAHKPSLRPNIYDRSLNKTRTAEISASAFAFLFSEMVQYTQKRVSGINDLERRSAASLSLFLLSFIARRLNTLGYRVGARVLELMVWRAESSSKTPKREIRFLPALMSVHIQVWRAVFGRPADAIEKSVENQDECMSLLVSPSALTPPTDMIIDNDPLLERHISVPRDLSTLSCSSFAAGIVEAVLDGLGFVSLVVFPLMLFSIAPSPPE